MIGIKKKKKLITGPDGRLLYPHPFSQGQMIKFKQGYEGLDGFVGFAIITDVDDDSISVYFQKSQTYMKYTIASAVNSFEVV